MELFGAKAGAVLEPKLEIYTEQEGYLVDVTPRYNIDDTAFTSLFKNEILHFTNCIINGTKCINPVEDGGELMRIIDAIYESAKRCCISQLQISQYGIQTGNWREYIQIYYKMQAGNGRPIA